MRQTLFYSLLTLAGAALLLQAAPAEARGHCRSHCHRSTSVQLSVGNAFPYRETYIVRSYPRVVPGTVIAPAPMIAPAPVIAPGYYGPCVPPAVIYPAPAYVEQVYVAPAPRPALFSGLSFSWNFFK